MIGGLVFRAYSIALEMVRELGPLLERIRRRDRKLEDQGRRAAASVALNLAEGWRRVGKDRLHLFRIAAGSADEVVAVLDVSEAFGYLRSAETAAVRSQVDQVLAITYRLTH